MANWLQLEDAEWTAVALEAQIAAQVAARQQQPSYQPLPFAPVAAVDPAPPASLPASASQLEQQLARLRHLSATAVVPELSHSAMMRLPLLGPVLSRVRLAFHQLACFYVNKLATQIAQTDAARGRLLAEMVQQMQAQEAEIARLRQQLAEKEGGDR